MQASIGEERSKFDLRRAGSDSARRLVSERRIAFFKVGSSFDLIPTSLTYG